MLVLTGVGSYRIVHTSVNSANDKSTIDTSVVAGNGFAVRIDPQQQNQIWKFSISPTDRRPYGGNPSFAISSQSGSRDDLAGSSAKSWRVFRVPLASDKQNDQYIIYDETDDTFLSSDRSSGKVSLVKPLTLDELIISAIKSSSAGVAQGPDIANLLWRLNPSVPLLQEGNYQLIWPGPPLDRCVARGKATNTAPVLAPVNVSDGSQWWNISLQVSSTGNIFYNIRNYVSGELLQLSKAGFTVGATNGANKTEFQIASDGQTGTLSTVGSDSQVIAVDSSLNLVVQSRDKPATWKIKLGVPVLTVAPSLPPTLPSSLTTKSWAKSPTDITFPSDPSQSVSLQALQPLDDGIYRVVNESTKRLACLTISQNGSGLAKSLGLIDGVSTSQSSYEQIWRLKRLTSYQGLIYQVINYSDSTSIAEQHLNAVAASDGSDCLAVCEDSTDPYQLWTIESQSNFSYTIKSYGTGSLLEDCGTLKNTPLIDAPRVTQRWKMTPAPLPVAPGLYRLRFQDGDYLQASATSTADKSLAVNFNTCRITSRRDGTNSVEIGTPTGLYFLGCDSQGQLMLTERCQEYSKLKFLPTGDETPGYYLQQASTNLTLTLTAPNSINVLDSHDDLRVKLNIAASFEARILGSPNQIITLEMPPDQVPSISSSDTVPTFTLQEGLYTIVSSRHTYLFLNDLVHLPPPSIPRSRFQAVAVNPPSGSQMQQAQWAIQSTGNGFYTISCSNLFLCQASSIVESACWPFAPNYPSNPGQTFPLSQDTWSANDVVGTTPSYDAARWKLISTDGQTFNIINYSTSHILQVDNPGYTISTTPSTPFPSLGTFTFIRLGDIPPAAIPRYRRPASLIDNVTLQPVDNSTAIDISRELEMDSGVFVLKYDGESGTTRCLALSDNEAMNGSMPLDVKLTGLDSEPYSLDSGLQHWTMVKNDDGWYTIQHYLYGFTLSAVSRSQGGKRVYPSSAPSVGLYSAQFASTWSEKAIFQWKFIEVDQRACMINRACDDYCLISDGSSCKFARPSDDQPFWYVRISSR